MTAPQPLPPKVMTHRPMDYPTVSVSSLSEDAKSLLGVNRRLNPDVAQKRAIDELVDAHVARWDATNGWLNVIDLHPDYTVATGRGTQFVQVYYQRLGSHRRQLLATVLGADLRTLTRHEAPVHQIVARHEDATDFEHDAAHVFDLELGYAAPIQFLDYGQTRIKGTMTALRAYPFGIDPLDVVDAYLGSTGREHGLCTDCTTPHAFAPHLPPESPIALVNNTTDVELFPMAYYEVITP